MSYQNSQYVLPILEILSYVVFSTRFSFFQYGFPGGDVDAAEKIEVDSDSENELSEESGEEEEMEEEERKVGEDARAGNVDVLLPPLDFDTEDMLKVLREVRNKNDTTTKSRKTLIQLISK